VRYWTLLLAAAVLVSCGGPSKSGGTSSAHVVVNTQTASLLHIPQIPPVQLGKRPAGTPITRRNMPYFDIVIYCEHVTHGKEKLRRGPLYETCAEDQSQYRDIIGETIDAGKFHDGDILRCAKASRTAYEGEWYCLNGEPF
jgi:hypothetical protein